jgi:hypothetical protein
MTAATALILAGLAGTSTLAYLWRDEAASADALQAALTATDAELSTTNRALSETESRLQTASSLADRRRALLVQARAVLSRVDALLSSVDDIQGRARNMKDARYTFSSDADALIATTVTLVNYLVATDSSYLSYSYVDSLISEANSQLGAVRGDQYSLSEQDGAYDDATSRFGTQADAFSKAVRSLQRQLKVAVEK